MASFLLNLYHFFRKLYFAKAGILPSVGIILEYFNQLRSKCQGAFQ